MSKLTLERASRAVALERVADFLKRHGVEDARRDARALLIAAAGVTSAELLLEPATLLSREASDKLREHAERRAAREPVSRIVGERGFWMQELLVAEGVLDPRPDTETLVECAVALLDDRRGEALSILDLGVGSGAIVCALLFEFANARAIAVDLSAKACAAAAANLARCGVAERASVLRGCWAQALDARFDLIVSNPPYVASADIESLAPEVRLYDPQLALDGGDDGLSCYRDIAADLPRLLAPQGIAVLEVGAGQAPDVSALLVENGLEIVEVRRDMAGHQRAVAARMRDRRDEENSRARR
jgi:release factor glutamine methyltransferase